MRAVTDRTTQQKLKVRIYVQHQLTLLPAAPLLAYLFGVIYQYDDREIFALLAVWLPRVGLALLIAFPYFVVHRMVDRALKSPEGDAPGDRLHRILALPRRLELAALAWYLGTFSAITLPLCLVARRPVVLVAPTLLVTAVLIALSLVRQTLKVEELLRPLAVAELERHPEVHPRGAGFAWPRQVWYLPYVTLLVMLASFVTLGVIVIRRFQSFMTGVLGELQQQGQTAVAEQVPRWMQHLLESLVFPSVIGLGYVLLLGALTAAAAGRRLRSGARAVEESVRGLASGAPRLPAWPATDELGDLAFATAGALAGLRAKAVLIARSAHTVDQVAHELSALVEHQMRAMSAQSAALRQTRRTAEEIQRTATMASDRARAVLSAADAAEVVGRSGREAVEASLSQLGELSGHAGDMAGRMTELESRAQRIARITMVVKELADQSNMVALNAAIEATRAGESGKTFAVVAQQIRRLSDESTAATLQAQDALRDVQGGIQEVVELSGAGRDRADQGMELAKGYGEDLRRLIRIVEDNAAAARQISAAVSQQSAGIGQIFEAITELGAAMDQTVEALHSTEAITGRAQQAAREVEGAMAGYRWEQAPRE
jgi:methyl-accepting chemotaxis protein